MDSKNLQKSRKRFENKSCNKVHFQISKDFFSCLVDVSSETEILILMLKCTKRMVECNKFASNCKSFGEINLPSLQDTFS